jgi:hypothetical protein
MIAHFVIGNDPGTVQLNVGNLGSPAKPCVCSVVAAMRQKAGHQVSFSAHAFNFLR